MQAVGFGEHFHLQHPYTPQNDQSYFKNNNSIPRFFSKPALFFIMVLVYTSLLIKEDDQPVGWLNVQYECFPSLMSLSYLFSKEDLAEMF